MCDCLFVSFLLVMQLNFSKEGENLCQSSAVLAAHHEQNQDILLKLFNKTMGIQQSRICFNDCNHLSIHKCASVCTDKQYVTVQNIIFWYVWLVVQLSIPLSSELIPGELEPRRKTRSSLGLHKITIRKLVFLTKIAFNRRKALRLARF